MYQIYKLLRGSIAFNIFIGALILYAVSWLVKALDMQLLSGILGQFVNIGVIILIIIFQPEVRRFLLFLGNSTLRQRSNFFDRFLDKNFDNSSKDKIARANHIRKALVKMSSAKEGALIVLAKNSNVDYFAKVGTVLEAEISASLLLSIFNKEAPLHDGAVIISNGKVHSASSVLPVSDNPSLPRTAGLRHRAAVGITEKTEVAAFIVSEESGHISFAYKGKLTRDITERKLKELLLEHLG